MPRKKERSKKEMVKPKKGRTPKQIRTKNPPGGSQTPGAKKEAARRRSEKRKPPK